MQELEQMLVASGAVDAFKEDVRALMAGDRPRRIAVQGHIPDVKVHRLLKQVLTAEPALPIEELRLEGYSGCSDFRGIVELRATDATRRYEFHWDCRWRAEQERWTDCFGLPDQIRAAQEFDWRCFRVWRPAAERAKR